MDKETARNGGDGRTMPDDLGETMMAAVVAIPKPEENKLRYELRLNPQMSLQEQVDFCLTITQMAATSAAKLRAKERSLPKIQVPGLNLPPDLTLPPAPGWRGKGRG